jgi:hypothetical protein
MKQVEDARVATLVTTRTLSPQLQVRRMSRFFSLAPPHGHDLPNFPLQFPTKGLCNFYP